MTCYQEQKLKEISLGMFSWGSSMPVVELICQPGYFKAYANYNKSKLYNFEAYAFITNRTKKASVLPAQ